MINTSNPLIVLSKIYHSQASKNLKLKDMHTRETKQNEKKKKRASS